MWEIIKDYYVTENNEDFLLFKEGDLISGELIQMTTGFAPKSLFVETERHSVIIPPAYFRTPLIEESKGSVFNVRHLPFKRGFYAAFALFIFSLIYLIKKR